MSEPRWMMAAISGLGECVMWVSPESLSECLSANMLVEVESVTQVILAPKGAVLRRVTSKAMIHGSLVALVWEAPEDLAKDLSRLWDDKHKGGIAMPSDGERRRFGLVP